MRKDYLENLEILRGFEFIEAYEQECETSINGKPAGKEFVTIINFRNKNHVAIDLVITDGEVTLSEPYAVDDEGKPYKGTSINTNLDEVSKGLFKTCVGNDKKYKEEYGLPAFC